MIVISFFLIIIIIIITILLIHVQGKFLYWQKKNVACITPSFPFGNMENLLTRKYYLGEWIKIFYHKFKKQGVKHAGFFLFTNPNYIPIDLEIIKNILQTDFQYFSNRGVYYNEKDDPLSAHLFAIGGQKWKHLRSKLTPTFTTGKMRTMFDTLLNCVHPMKEVMDTHYTNNQPVHIKDILARFSTDVIGSCAFGLECNSFKEKETKFNKYGQKVFETPNIVQILQRLFANLLPELARKLGVCLLSKDVTNFFLNVVKDTVDFRHHNNIDRNDMLQILINLKNTDHTLTIDQIAAQAFVFFLAGFETSSTTLSFCFYELAENVEVQNKVRNEINLILNKYDGNITYNSLAELKYMNQVIHETLRKYPPGTFVTRQCVKDYLVPGTNVVVEKDTVVLIPIWGLHSDPEYFKDPLTFDPERFSEENKRNINPFTFMPFGQGPRNCVGKRFGMLQVKLGLTYLLRHYSFTVNRKTKLPFKWNKYGFILTTESPIWLDVQKIC